MLALLSDVQVTRSWSEVRSTSFCMLKCAKCSLVADTVTLPQSTTSHVVCFQAIMSSINNNVI